MVKTWLIYLVSLISTFIFFLFYKMWVSWICLVILLLLPFIALGVCLLASRTLTFNCEFPDNTTVGSSPSLRINVNNIASQFSFCKIQTVFDDYMGGTTEVIQHEVHDSGMIKIPVKSEHCGAYSCRVTKVLIYDLFGFFHMSKNISKSGAYLILPSPIMPEIMPDAFGFKAKNLRKTNNQNTGIYDIREYQQGDPLKSIHWKMSAKKDNVLVKEPLEEFGGHSRVFVKLTEDRELLDRHLGQIMFTSRFYIDHEISHNIRVIPPDKSEVAFQIESETDLLRAINNILHMRIPSAKDRGEESTEEEIAAEYSGRDGEGSYEF